MIWYIITAFLYVSIGNFLTVAWAVSEIYIYGRPKKPIAYYLYFLLWGPALVLGICLLILRFLIMKGKELYAKASHKK